MSRQTKRTKAAKADSGGQNLAPTLPVSAPAYPAGSVLHVRTESGDEHHVRLVAALSERQLEAHLRRLFPDEFQDDDDGPGRWGSYLYVRVVA